METPNEQVIKVALPDVQHEILCLELNQKNITGEPVLNGFSNILRSGFFLGP